MRSSELSDQEKAPAETEEPARIITYKKSPVDTERRTARIQIICKPSIVRKVSAVARDRGISVSYLFETMVDAEYSKLK